ncbi:MAG: class I SAM-dependent methyltransferase [Acidobacteria bacterium]|nr:class I SAM-dependent methyltransferase [Acidobacteriota bacterium]
MIEARGSRGAIVRAYDLYSLLYGRAAARLHREAVSRGLVKAAVQPGERILEVAVGPGAVHERLRRRLAASGLLVGIDLSIGMLRAARRRVPGARLARANALQLPFGDAQFDLVWASYLLDLIPTDEMAPLLAEFCRVLRAGGRLALVNLSRSSSANGLTRWERYYRRTPAFLVPWVFAGCRPVEAEPFVRAAGFVEVERELVEEGLTSEVITARKIGTTDALRFTQIGKETAQGTR